MEHTTEREGAITVNTEKKSFSALESDSDDEGGDNVASVTVDHNKRMSIVDSDSSDDESNTHEQVDLPLHFRSSFYVCYLFLGSSTRKR